MGRRKWGFGHLSDLGGWVGGVSRTRRGQLGMGMEDREDI